MTNRYDAALYWRFLYEGFNDMGVVRAALEEMACGYSPDIVPSLEAVMNNALARVDGPFHTFEESLSAFARANYALRLENGRCAAADLTDCGGFYFDPNRRYADPPLEAELAYDGAPQSYDGAIPASFGMDFVEVRLNPAVHNQPLSVRLEGGGGVAQFNVQIWKLGSGAKRPWAVTPQPEMIPRDGVGVQVYTIPHVNTAAYDTLALIITRLDPHETDDPVGNYRITLGSGG